MASSKNSMGLRMQVLFAVCFRCALAQSGEGAMSSVLLHYTIRMEELNLVFVMTFESPVDASTCDLTELVLHGGWSGDATTLTPQYPGVCTQELDILVEVWVDYWDYLDIVGLYPGFYDHISTSYLSFSSDFISPAVAIPTESPMQATVFTEYANEITLVTFDLDWTAGNMTLYFNTLADPSSVTMEGLTLGNNMSYYQLTGGTVFTANPSSVICAQMIQEDVNSLSLLNICTLDVDTCILMAEYGIAAIGFGFGSVTEQVMLEANDIRIVMQETHPHMHIRLTLDYGGDCLVETTLDYNEDELFIDTTTVKILRLTCSSGTENTPDLLFNEICDSGNSAPDFYPGENGTVFAEFPNGMSFADHGLYTCSYGSQVAKHEIMQDVECTSEIGSCCLPVIVLQHPNTLLVELYSPLTINLKVVTWPQIGPDQLEVLRDDTQEQSPLISRKSSQSFEAFYANALYSHAGSYSVLLPQLNFQSSSFNVKVIDPTITKTPEFEVFFTEDYWYTEINCDPGNPLLNMTWSYFNQGGGEIPLVEDECISFAAPNRHRLMICTGFDFSIISNFTCQVVDPENQRTDLTSAVFPVYLIDAEVAFIDITNNTVFNADILPEYWYCASIFGNYNLSVALTQPSSQDENIVPPLVILSEVNYIAFMLPTQYSEYTLSCMSGESGIAVNLHVSTETCMCEVESSVDYLNLCSSRYSNESCACSAGGNCECLPPLVGSGDLCTLDSDGDGYPDHQLAGCTDNEAAYCHQDNCPEYYNPDQEIPSLNDLLPDEEVLPSVGIVTSGTDMNVLLANGTALNPNYNTTGEYEGGLVLHCLSSTEQEGEEGEEVVWMALGIPQLPQYLEASVEEEGVSVMSCLHHSQLTLLGGLKSLENGTLVCVGKDSGSTSALYVSSTICISQSTTDSYSNQLDADLFTTCPEEVVIEMLQMKADEIFSPNSSLTVDEMQEAVSNLTHELASATAPKPDQAPLDSQDLMTVNSITEDVLDFLDETLTANVSTPLNEDVADVLNNLLDVSYDPNWQEINDKAEAGVLETVANTEQYAGYISQALVSDSVETGQNTRNITVSRKNLVLSAEVVDEDSLKDVIFPKPQDLVNTTFEQTVGVGDAMIRIPAQQLQERMDTKKRQGPVKLSVVNVMLRASESIPVRNGTLPVTPLLSSQVFPLVKDDFTTPAELTFTNVPVGQQDIFVTENPRCAFWNFSDPVGNGNWSIAGLESEETAQTSNGLYRLVCKAYHLTSFAVLVDIKDSEPEFEMVIFTIIGCGISIACLVLTIILLLLLGKELFNSVHYFVHLNLAIALLLGYTVFLATGIIDSIDFRNSPGIVNITDNEASETCTL